MSDSWTPLWSSIVRSSLWREPKEVRLLFVTMLALKNADGKVYGKLHWLADQAQLTLEETRSALHVLMEPDRNADPDDRPQPDDGRRVKVLAEPEMDGWLIINHEKYHALMKKIAARNRKALWAREHRAGLPSKGKPLPGENQFCDMEKSGRDVSLEPGNKIPLPTGSN